ncbi:hypothetical protein V12B01_12955 [Vibrio splendidus 12B01]|nr:hypothetical protein V12B01_12955 [Vibrio splendidus 12B01]
MNSILCLFTCHVVWVAAPVVLHLD